MTLTNEELVAHIYDGDSSYIEQLWNQVSGFVWFMANKRLNNSNVPDHIRNAYSNDLFQSGYFALLDAIKTYDAERGKSFTSFMNFYLKSRFSETLNLKTDKGYMDPLRYSVSLDAVISGTEEFTLQEVVMDPKGEEELENILDETFKKDVHEFIYRAINSLEIKEQMFFKTLLECNYDRSLAAKKLNIEYLESRKLYDKGIIAMRKFMLARKREMIAIGLVQYFYE